MKLRHINSKIETFGDKFNTFAMSEIYVFTPDCMDTDFIKNYEVYLETGPDANTWVSLSHAFTKRNVVSNNYNTHFAEPVDAQSRERGYND